MMSKYCMILPAYLTTHTGILKFIFVKVNASNWGKESMILEVLFYFVFYLQWEKIKQTFNKLKIGRLADSLYRCISNI